MYPGNVNVCTTVQSSDKEKVRIVEGPLEGECGPWLRTIYECGSLPVLWL